ncbi:MAG: serine/threonine-protein kinase, partial [Gemmataceae bacterium]|nr:serine/threonine-protein kinase [Gemmataceae bacterium]
AHPDFAETGSFGVADLPTPSVPAPDENAQTGTYQGPAPAPAGPPEDAVTRTFGGGPVPSLGGQTRTYSYGLDRPKARRGGGEVLRGPAPPGYEILGELGRGGMGVVYKARQVKLNRIVALKMILAGGHAGAEQLQRFQTEAEASARLQHPGIVQVYELGDHDGLPYFAIEYVEGGPLHKKTKKEPQPPELAAAITQGLARAIQFAHDHNVVHRDLKPQNVLVGADGALKIADFGLAKKLEEEEGQTLSGSIVGTPQYMAPEQARGDTRHAGPAADQYSLGAILYELLTGRPPLAGATVMETLNLVQNQDPVPVRDLQPKVPIDLETVCLKCLQKEPEKRYATAGELADDLGRFLNGVPILARPVGPAERLWRWCRRNPRVAGLLAGVAGLLVTIAAGSMAFAYQINQLKDAETEAKNLAEANEKRAKENEELAKKNEEVARAERGVAVDSLLKLATSVQGELGRKPGLQDLREKLFKVAADGIAEAGKRGFEPKLARAVAGMYQQQGDFFRDQVPPKTAEAIKMYAEAHKIAADLAAADPDNPVYQINLAAMTGRLGEVHRRAGDIPAARRFLEETVARRER